MPYLVRLGHLDGTPQVVYKATGFAAVYCIAFQTVVGLSFHVSSIPLAPSSLPSSFSLTRSNTPPHVSGGFRLRTRSSFHLIFVLRGFRLFSEA